MKHLVSFLFVLVFVALATSIANAQNKKSLTTLSPALLEMSIDNIEESGYPVMFENGENIPLDVKVTFVPFAQSGLSDGSLEFLQDEPSTLSNFLVPSSNEFRALPKSKTTIHILPNEFSKTLKGDYYEAIVFSSSPVNASSETKKSKSSIIGSLALLVFFRSDPKATAKYTLTQDSPNIPTFMTKPPGEISLTIENRGNTYGIPRGEVKVVNLLGSTVARGIINIDSVRIIPSSSKKISVKIIPVDVPLLAYMGVFDVVLRDDRQMSARNVFRKSFFVIDPIFAAGLVVGLVTFISAILFIRIRYAKR